MVKSAHATAALIVFKLNRYDLAAMTSDNGDTQLNGPRFVIDHVGSSSPRSSFVDREASEIAFAPHLSSGKGKSANN